MLKCHNDIAVADPGFPRGGHANPKEGRQPINWPFFPENCRKMKEFWAGGGGTSLAPPLDPPLHWQMSDYLKTINILAKMTVLGHNINKPFQVAVQGKNRGRKYVKRVSEQYLHLCP